MIVSIQFYQKKPDKHTYIFIKEKLRCAKTLNKKYLGILYERFTDKPDDAVIIQSLLGRCTGYNYNGKTICFTNLESVDKYEELWISKFGNKNVRWISKTTKMKNKSLVSKGTYNGQGLDGGNEEENKLETKNFRTFDEAKKYIRDTIKGARGPSKTPGRVNSEGFHESCIRDCWKVRLIEDIENDGWGLTKSGTKKYRLHIGYLDIEDITTKWYVVLHYIKK